MAYILNVYTDVYATHTLNVRSVHAQTTQHTKNNKYLIELQIFLEHLAAMESYTEISKLV